MLGSIDVVLVTEDADGHTGTWDSVGDVSLRKSKRVRH
jgi:hypothetical protein